jgi:hypothetical protein
MRFQINIDCTPEEAREFFGMPDILPMQQDLMEKVSRRLSENIQTMEAEELMKTWVPALFQGWTDIQSQFWNQFSQMGGKTGKHNMDFNFNPTSFQNPEDEETRDDKKTTAKSRPKPRKRE